LLAAMYSLKGNKPVALQRVFFTDKGEKLGSMMLGPVGGACMKLTEHYQTFSDSLMFCPRLFITEGVETGLAVLQQGFAPVWALGSAGAIERMPVLFGIGELVICADNDPPGLNAAKACAMRWNATTHQHAVIRAPATQGHDFADGVGGAP
jgi:putative DNA primase/helicase